MPRVYTYLRTATTEADAAFEATASLHSWLVHHPDHQVLGRFQDTGVSGLTAPGERSGFAALLAALAQETGDAIVLVPASHHISRQRGIPEEVRQQLAVRGVRLLNAEIPPDGGLQEQMVVTRVLSAIHDYHRSRRRTRRSQR